MKKIYIQNLGMIVTNRCNLNCAHCLRGGSCNIDMSSEVIKATLDQIIAIGNLCICGGEPTLALPIIEEIFKYCIDNYIYISQVSTTINGTIYSEDFLTLLNDMYAYISRTGRDTKVDFLISGDQYHIDEVNRLKIMKKYIENIEKYKKSKRFLGIQDIEGKVFKEGNAKKLSDDLTIPLRVMPSIMTYVGKFKKLDIENGLCNIGPIVTISPTGIITECDADIEEQNTIYNYGNVLNDSIEEVYRAKSKILKPRVWYKKTGEYMKIYKTYDK